jgi:CheY-like chemotaxis protein
MKQPKILLVDPNPGRAQIIRDAIAGLMLVQPIHRPDGEASVLWSGANECHLVLICYEQPGMDGLETLARIRNRKPSVPAIVYSESKDQAVAIAAFRAGAHDFIPIVDQFHWAMAEVAQELLDDSESVTPSQTRAITDPTLAHIPRERLELTYQNRLRTIGRQLDVYGYHTATIIEVDGGFLVRAHRQRARLPQALEFPDRDFPRLVASAIHEERAEEKRIHQTELTPTGYEDLLRALGYRLDEASAEAIVITELEDQLVVAGKGYDKEGTALGIQPFAWFLKEPDVELMLNEAFRRRGTHRPKIKRPAPQSTGFRGLLRRLN